MQCVRKILLAIHPKSGHFCRQRHLESLWNEIGSQILHLNVLQACAIILRLPSAIRSLTGRLSPRWPYQVPNCLNKASNRALTSMRSRLQIQRSNHHTAGPSCGPTTIETRSLKSRSNSVLPAHTRYCPNISFRESESNSCRTLQNCVRNAQTKIRGSH